MEVTEETLRNKRSALQQDDDDHDLPPPGFELGDSQQWRNPYFSSAPSTNVVLRSNNEVIFNTSAETPFPSFNYIGESLPPSFDEKQPYELQPKLGDGILSTRHIKGMEREEDEDGPPPGWETKTIEMKLDDVDSDADVPPGWQSLTPSPSSSPSQQPHTTFFSSEPPLPQPFSSPPYPEMGQLVCGCCRMLLSYPKGYREIQCGGCQVTNYVLEADEIGTVKCDQCAVLLMYTYSASSVQCTSCSSITQIGEYNKRPPWSVQQQAS